MLTYKWRRRGQEIMFSWLVSLPLVILHADIWVPGHFTDSNGNVVLMNGTRYMTQSIVFVSVPDETSATFAEHFM